MSKDSKIYYIANARLPTKKAHGIHIMNMCSALAREGNEVELVVPRRINNTKEDPFKYYDISKNFKIKKIFCLDLIVLDKYIGQIGFFTQLISFYFFTWFYLLVKRRNCIIYTRDYLGIMFAWYGFKVIYECHYLPERGTKLFWYLVKKFDKSIIISNELKKAFIQAGIEEQDVLVAPDGVDLVKFDINLSKEEARQKLNLPTEKKIIVYTGHLYAWKGTNTLAQAVNSLDNAMVYFVGGTSKDIKEFKEKYKELINKGRVVVAGHKPQKEIPIWLKAADALVLPNTGKEKISKYYTSPLKLFEYMASQRPIVASRLPSLKTVLNEQNCVFFEPDDSKDLVKKISRVLTDNELANNIADQAYREVKEYSWEERAKRIMGIIIDKK